MEYLLSIIKYSCSSELKLFGAGNIYFLQKFEFPALDRASERTLLTLQLLLPRY